MPPKTATLLSPNRGHCAAPDGCTEPWIAKGLCKIHYMRQYKRRRYNQTPRSLWATNVSVKAVHRRCTALWGRAADHPCVDCGGGAKEWAYDGTDPTDIYARHRESRKGEVWSVFSRFPEFYMPLCISCHRRRDRRDNARIVHQYRLLRYGVVSGGDRGFAGE